MKNCIYKILQYPDIRLRKKACSIISINQNIIQIIHNMINTMYFYNGIGLSATQVNIHKKILVIDISKNQNNPLIFINPKILKKYSNIINSTEGCLSIPNFYSIISRYQKIKVSALNISGKFFSMKAKNLLSICLQHELDHLIGKLFIDYLSPIHRKKFLI